MQLNDPALEPLLNLGVSLAELAVKNTATAVATKIKTLKEEKNLEKVRNAYDEIINNLLSEKQEAIRIAQAYKNELEKIQISDEDILHLHNTVGNFLNVLQKFSPTLGGDELNNIISLISVDTLRAMQLLGFNYKAAIGEPLTKLCADKISSAQRCGRRLSPQKG